MAAGIVKTRQRLLADDIDFEKCMLFGKTAIFTPVRIDKHKLPEELYSYALCMTGRNDRPFILRKEAVGQCYGVILSDRSYQLPKDGRILESYNCTFLGKYTTLKRYVRLVVGEEEELRGRNNKRTTRSTVAK